VTRSFLELLDLLRLRGLDEGSGLSIGRDTCFLNIVLPVGHENSDQARDQVFLRVHSTCSASAATAGKSRLSNGPDTCFLKVVRRHRPPCLTSGSQEGSISHHGNGPRVPDQPNGARGKPLVRATIGISAPFTRRFRRSQLVAFRVFSHDLRLHRSH
jgi:hypothetical protein